jgi:hypothetical protein
MTFDTNERGRLAALADVLIPSGEGCLSASQAGVADAGLDQALSFRPDLGNGLKRALTLAGSHPPEQAIAELERNDPASLGLLAELVAGAYFLNPEVRARLGYQGQGPRPIDPRPDYLADGLLQGVIDRGPIYRPTPGNERP